MTIQGEYQRTVSANDAGFQFERKMTILMTLRLYNTTDDYLIATNFGKGGKFDDLVFRFKRGSSWNTCFVQLKHKQSQLLQKKKISLTSLKSGAKGNQDFNLVKYLQSFIEIAKKYYHGDKDVIFESGYETASFFIFTNALLHDEILQKYKNRVGVDLFSTNIENEINLRFDPVEDADLLSNCSDFEKQCANEFLSKLVLCTGQASEEDLDALIDEEAKKASGLSSTDVKYVVGQLKEYFNRWFNAGQFLTKEMIKSVVSRTSLETVSGKKEEARVRFTKPLLKEYADRLTQGPNIILTSKSEDCLMCMVALKQIGYIDAPNKQMSIRKLENKEIQEHIVSSPGKFVLVIDCETDSLGTDMKQFVSFISRLNQAKPECLVILVVTTKNIALLNGISALNAKKQAFNCSLKHLDDESRDLIMHCNLLFQGYKTPLESLIKGTKALDDVFDMVAMTDLLRGRDLNVGIKPVDQITYYITRMLTRCTISEKVFTSSQPDLRLAVRDIVLDDAKKCIPLPPHLIVSVEDVYSGNATADVKVIVLEDCDPTEAYERLSSMIPNLHLLACVGRRPRQSWHWQKSAGNFRGILRHLEWRLPQYVKTDNIMAIADKVVVVSAEPGMGKSTLLVHLAAETKRLCPHIWVINVCLNDYTDHFAHPKFMGKLEENVKRIVAHAAGVSSETSKFDARLFNYCYDVSGNMVILLDGFDEITPYYTKQGIALIRVLQSTKIDRVWVTTRPVMRRILQDELSTLAYAMRPFGESDQRSFFAKYWKEQIADISNASLNTFIDKIIELINGSFDEELNVFTGIPLQTRMIAEVFNSEMLTYHQTGNLGLPKALNGLQLFKAFVDKKLEIMLGEKSKMAATNASARQVYQRLIDAHEMFLMQLALLTLLPTEICAKLVPPVLEIKELKRRVTEGEENAGIVLSFKADVPQFIHRTFAEYYVAKFFCKRFSTNRDFLLSELFFSNAFSFVRYFFDRMLAGDSPLHSAVLERDSEALQAALETNKVDVNVKDDGGRTALHLAANLPDSEDIVRSLLKAGCSASIRDSLMEWLPIEYAIKNRNTGNIAPLIDGPSSYPLVKDVIPVTCDSLKLAVTGDYLPLLLYLFENNIIATIGIDTLPSHSWKDEMSCEGFTLLHLAAVYNAVTILQYLLRKDHRDSKEWLKDRTDQSGRTPLLLAIANHSVDVAKLLLAAGAELPKQTEDGDDLGQLAVQTNDFELLQLLLKTAKKRGTGVEWFAGALTLLVAEKSQWSLLALIELFSEFPRAVDTLTKKNVPLIIAASIKGNDTAINVLIGHGVDVNVVHNDRTALHVAVVGGHDKAVEALLQTPNIDLEVKDSFGCTALYLAAEEGDSTVFDLLVKRGAALSCKSSDGSDLSHVAAKSDSEAIMEILVNKGFTFKTENSEGLTGLAILEEKGSKFSDRLKAPRAKIFSVFDTMMPNAKVASASQPELIRDQPISEAAKVKIVQPVEESKKKKRKAKAKKQEVKQITKPADKAVMELLKSKLGENSLIFQSLVNDLGKVTLSAPAAPKKTKKAKANNPIANQIKPNEVKLSKKAKKKIEGGAEGKAVQNMKNAPKGTAVPQVKEHPKPAPLIEPSKPKNDAQPGPKQKAPKNKGENKKSVSSLEGNIASAPTLFSAPIASVPSLFSAPIAPNAQKGPNSETNFPFRLKSCLDQQKVGGNPFPFAPQPSGGGAPKPKNKPQPPQAEHKNGNQQKAGGNPFPFAPQPSSGGPKPKNKPQPPQAEQKNGNQQKAGGNPFPFTPQPSGGGAPKPKNKPPPQKTEQKSANPDAPKKNKNKAKQPKPATPNP